MDLNTIDINVGEFIEIEGLYLYRNEYAYLIFKKIENEEYFGNILYFNEQYYCVMTLPDLRSYKTEDFL